MPGRAGRNPGNTVTDDNLQLAEHLSFQRQVWQSQRSGWVALALILCAAALGLTGDGGPFARRVLVAGDLAAEVPRVSRAGAADTITLATPAIGGLVSLLVDTAFLRAFDLGAIRPAPLSQEARPDGLALTIAAQGDGPLDIVLSVQPTAPGWRSYGLAVDGRRITATTLVLP